MSKKPLILVTCKQMQNELPLHRERIESLGYEVLAPELVGQQFTAAQLAQYSEGMVGIIAGDDELNRSFFDATPDLKVLIRWGIGMDSVDHEAAADHDVVVRNTPGVFGREVADSAFAYVLMLARGHHGVDSDVRNGSWPKREGITLGENRVGVVGLGAIGRQVAQRGLGFGMEVVGFDPYVDSEHVAEGVSRVSLDELLSTSRFVILTCPLTEDTFHLIDTSALARMRRDAYLINVARGPVVDEVALCAALTEGLITGAGLDVFEVEPLPVDSPLRELENVILGAHNGSNTREGVQLASRVAVDLLLKELAQR